MERTAVFGVCVLMMILLALGCSDMGKWPEPGLEGLAASGVAPAPLTCAECHETEHNSWNATAHADPSAMAGAEMAGFSGCGACHDSLEAHINSPMDHNPTQIGALDKTEQNRICGKCHFSKRFLGGKAFNPHNDHGLFTSVGFEGKTNQLSCLDCHAGHSTRGNMLSGMQAHLCFKCHKSAIVTMGVFQPLNYLTAGKTCTSCHAVHGTSKGGQAVRMTLGIGTTCAVCHIL